MMLAHSWLLFLMAVLTMPKYLPEQFSRSDLGSHLTLIWPIATTRLRAHSRSARTDISDRSILWALAISADLRAGLEANAALADACTRFDIAPLAGNATRIGSDVTTALREDARRSESQILASAAACWSIQSVTGVGLARALQATADASRMSQKVDQTIEAELAAPRATANLMSGLPLLGIALAWLMGANPLAWLFGSVIGLATLTLGIGLNLLGAFWTRSLVTQVAGRR